MRPRIAYLTYDGVDVDRDEIVAALRHAGCDAVPLVWTNADYEFGDFDAMLLGSVWDYPMHATRFERWLEGASRGTTLINNPLAVRWNLRKTYLRELAVDARLPVVPTLVPETMDQVESLPTYLRDHRWDEIVVKPVFGNGGVGALRTRDHARGTRHATSLLHSGGAVVQPYLDTVETLGETSLIFFGGALSHAVQRGPLLRRDQLRSRLMIHGTPTAQSVRPIDPPQAAAVLGRAVLSWLRPLRPVYARVDLLRGANGGYMVSEVELIEPFFYLCLFPGIADRLVRALTEHLGERAVRSAPATVASGS